MRVKVLIRRDIDYTCILGVFTDDEKLEFCKRCDREDCLSRIADDEPIYEIEEYDLNETGWVE